MADERDPKQILTSITDDVRTIVRSEIELAKSEVMPAVKKGGVGAGLFGGAGYFALNGLFLLFIAASLALSMLIGDLWPIGFVIMGVLLLIIAGVLALIGKKQIDQAKPRPEAAIAQAQTAVAEVKGAIRRGTARATGKQPELPTGATRELR